MNKIASLSAEQWNSRLEGLSAEEILEVVLQHWDPGEVVATSSFQNQSIPFLHLLSRRAPEVSVLFLETGFHFPETLDFRDTIAKEFGLKVRNLQPEVYPPEPRHLTDTDGCCALNKVQPLEEALRGAKVWLTGVRRSQTALRQSFATVETHKTGVLKINPILDWTDLDLLYYFREHPGLPKHPLGAQGYESIGCEPCTKKGTGRHGRWGGEDKTECGIHT